MGDQLIASNPTISAVGSRTQNQPRPFCSAERPPPTWHVPAAERRRHRSRHRPGSPLEDSGTPGGGTRGACRMWGTPSTALLRVRLLNWRSRRRLAKASSRGTTQTSEQTRRATKPLQSLAPNLPCFRAAGNSHPGFVFLPCPQSPSLHL